MKKDKKCPIANNTIYYLTLIVNNTYIRHIIYFSITYVLTFNLFLFFLPACQMSHLFSHPPPFIDPLRSHDTSCDLADSTELSCRHVRSRVITFAHMCCSSAHACSHVCLYSCILVCTVCIMGTLMYTRVHTSTLMYIGVYTSICRVWHYSDQIAYFFGVRKVRILKIGKKYSFLLL